MTTLSRVFPNFYRDSVSLMQLSAKLGALAGVEQAAAVMATKANLALLAETGLVREDTAPSPNNLLVVVRGGDETQLEAALAEAKAALEARPSASTGEALPEKARSIEMALGEMPDANLALVSTPGEYAADEARKALNLGLHVMLFSDNVSLEEEISLKHRARGRDLLVMGPDCGTAIINGIPLGFANVVRRGDIGCVAASGTGLQQVTCLVDRYGAGISQAIGTGGRDLKAEVGGMTMLQGIAALTHDPATRVIVLISKPPAPTVADRVLGIAARSGKPVVVNFLGAAPEMVKREGVHAARTLEDAARLAVDLATGKAGGSCGRGNLRAGSARSPDAARLAPSQKYIRGLYSGGTFCYEASFLLTEALGTTVYSNTPVDKRAALPDVWTSREHTVVDLGDDLFTRGRPHPMIDPRLRNERILAEAADPGVAVLLLDVVLGYGAHPDPAAEMEPAIRAARNIATKHGREILFVGSVCGTAADPQDLSRQEAALRDAGVLLANSNAEAVRLAAAIVGGARPAAQHRAEGGSRNG